MVKKSYFYAILFLTFLVSYFFAPLPLINLTITDISSNYSPIIITNPSSPPTVNFNVTTQSFYEEVANSVFFEEGTCSNGDEFINISPKVIGEVNWSINCTFALKNEGSYPLIIYSIGQLGNTTNWSYPDGYYIDFTPPYFFNFSQYNLEAADNFYSPLDNLVRVKIGINDTVSGVSTANVSFFLANNTSFCSSIELASGSGDYWYFQPGEGCNVSNVISAHNITSPTVAFAQVVASDFGGLTNSTTIPIILHNLGAIQGSSSPCFKEGNESTNLSSIEDFSNVNLVKVIELNGSASCNPLNLSLPWGNSFKKVAKFNFSSVNLSNQQQAALVAQAIGNLIQVQIARPFSFESSRIYVNSSALSSLNTSATVILYDLPFSTTPSVTYDEGPFDGSISWSQGPFNEQFGFFTGNLTLSLNKFSGYNISDKSNPTITISSPLSNQFYNNNKLINITANGTGTAISNLTITIRNSSGQVVNTFNYIFNGTNSANCTNKSAGYDQINCILYNVNLDPGIYNLTVVAYDFGSGNGNSANSSRLFQTNNFAPVINSVSITPTEAYKFNNLTCTVSPQNPDLEEIGDTLTINYKWYVNNNLVFSQSSTNLSSTLTNENYTDFDNVTCLVTVTDSYDQSAIQNTSKTILFSSHNILNLSSENKTTSSINISYSNTQTNGKGYLTIPSNTTLSNISQAYPKGLVFISEVVNLSSGDLAFNNSRASKFSNLTIKLGPAGLKFSPNITFSFNYSSLSSEIIQSINDLLQAGDLVVKKCQDNGSNCISVPIVSYNTTTKIITVSIDSFSSLGLYDNSAEQEPQTPSTSSSSNSGGGAILRSSPPTQTSSSEETKPPSPTSNEFKEEQPLPPKPPSKPIEQPSLPSEPQETQNKIETFQQQIPAEPATTVAETKEQAAASSSDNSLILGVVGLTLVILIGGGTLIWWLKARKSKGLI